jgi:hypothetical protein
MSPSALLVPLVHHTSVVCWFFVLRRTLCAITTYIGTNLWLSLCVCPTILQVWPLVLYQVLIVFGSLKLHLHIMPRMFPDRLFNGNWVVLLSPYLPILLCSIFMRIFSWKLHVAFVASSLNQCLSLLHMKQCSANWVPHLQLGLYSLHRAQLFCTNGRFILNTDKWVLWTSRFLMGQVGLSPCSPLTQMSFFLDFKLIMV